MKRIITVGIVSILSLSLVSCAAMPAAPANDTTTTSDIEEIKKRIDELKKENEQLREELASAEFEETKREAVGAEEEKAKDEDDALLEYAQELDYIAGMVGHYDSDLRIGDYGSQIDIRDYSNVPFGNIDCFIDDFDNDGQNELLIISVDGPENMNITLTMYEYDNEVKQVASYDMEGFYDPWDDWSEWMYFDYKYEENRCIGAVFFGDCGLLADGSTIGFFVCKYDGSSFEKIGNIDFSGSDFSDEAPDVTNEFHRCGVEIDWNDIFRRDLCDEVLSLTNGERLISINQCTNDYIRDENWVYTKMSGYIKYKGYSTYEFTKHEDTSITDNYILPDSSERLLMEEDLEGMSNDTLRKARNEIVARHGRRFKDEELQAYFNSKTWYYGTNDPDIYDVEMDLSDIERQNMNFIKNHEK